MYGIDRFIKNRNIFAYNSDDNLCVFASMVYYYNAGASHVMNIRTVQSKAKQYFTQFYNKTYTDSYEGFDMTDFKSLCNKFKFDVAIYGVEEKDDGSVIYSIRHEYFADEQANDQLNLLVVNVGSKFHVMLIKDVEALTGMMFCKICRRVVCPKDSEHGESPLVIVHSSDIFGCMRRV
jgi:hypothetical protein